VHEVANYLALVGVRGVELVLAQRVGDAGVGVSDDVKQGDCARRYGASHVLADIGVRAAVDPVAVGWCKAVALRVKHSGDIGVALNLREAFDIRR
jgi:hypothetical protein